MGIFDFFKKRTSRQPSTRRDHNMNTGEASIEWLFSEQLKVDAEWSIRTPTGFKWWADRHAQTVEVIGEETDPDGDTGYLISVRTELLRDLDLDDQLVALVNELLMGYATMAGPVYDEKSRTLDLCSLVRVHEDISSWMNPLISLAAVLQIDQARVMSAVMPGSLNAQEATSGHPENGMRPDPDEMAELVETLIAPMGQEPCRWTTQEFQSVVDEYMQKPPSLMGNAGDLGFTVEFPFGEESSLFVGKGDQPHPRYGNGLFMLQSFRWGELPDASVDELQSGARMALLLNSRELSIQPDGYGFGSWAFRNDRLHFTSFIPNVAYRPGLLPSIYFAAAQRARMASRKLALSDWNEESFSPRQSALGSLIDGLDSPTAE